ncbi:solute carrier family 22 member 7-like [Schistocerca cancellata]|uniref:solute carrier family 22 member 7-like n=1 Tax=Schistocerca cancellata TaxID=274614 RepID=UPI002118BBC5|nr:solute carrier family 22 member 7-like [Schistocerca cancellata]
MVSSYNTKQREEMAQTGTKQNEVEKDLLTALVKPPDEKQKQEKLGLGDEVELTPIEKLMEAAGTRGRFQRRFNWTFNLLVVIFAGMPYVNIVIALTVPDHWCHVPGREATNYTEDQWKALHIPRRADNSSFEQCLMLNSSGGEPVACQQGWDYDRTWFSSTAPSQEDWVCDHRLRAVNVLSFGQLGEVVGTFAFARMGDLYGRRPAFFLSAVSSAVTHCLMAFTASIYPLFFAVSLLASATNAATFQAPLVFSLEVSDEETKGFVAMLQCVGWTLGMMGMPMIAWACRDWVPFMIITSAPLGFAILLWKWFPESPRWLASQGEADRCLASLREIARVNGRTLPPATLQNLREAAGHKEKGVGVSSLFSSWTLFRNVMLLSVCRMIFSLAYYSVILNVTNLGGNPFLNWSVQSLAELPGYVAARFLADRLGRRWTLVGSVVGASVGNYIAASIVAEHGSSPVMTVLSVGIRLCLVLVNYTAYLQANEMFPTCVRQTGTAIGNIAACILGVLGPYIVHLGTWDARLPFLVVGGITTLGAALASFLPETLHVRLPETLHEARSFGRDQPYFSCLALRRRRQRRSQQPPPL